MFVSTTLLDLIILLSLCIIFRHSICKNTLNQVVSLRTLHTDIWNAVSVILDAETSINVDAVNFRTAAATVNQTEEVGEHRLGHCLFPYQELSKGVTILPVLKSDLNARFWAELMHPGLLSRINWPTQALVRSSAFPILIIEAILKPDRPN